MALTTGSSTELGCGRDIDEVWDHLDRPPDTHELTCPYCQAARTDLAGLAQATQQLRDDDAANPDRQPSPAVLDRILVIARAEVRRGRRLPLDQPEPDGTTPNTVSEQAVTAVVRRVGDRTTQVQIRRCATTTDAPTTAASRRPADDAATGQGGSPQAIVGAPSSEARDRGPASVRVSLRVSVAHNLVIAAVSSQLREAVITAVAQEVGMLVTTVDITVEDLHDV